MSQDVLIAPILTAMLTVATETVMIKETVVLLQANIAQFAPKNVIGEPTKTRNT